MLDNLSEEYIKKFQSLKEIIEELQKTITEHSDYLSQKETRTRQFLIDPLLRELGWDVLNPSAVQLEFGVKERDSKGTKQMDYALMLDDCPIAIIQAKQLNYKYVSLTLVARRTKNILDRAKLTNIHYIIVTDGNRWNIYECEDKVLKESLIMELNESSEASALRAMQVWKWKRQLASGSSMEKITPVLDSEQQEQGGDWTLDDHRHLTGERMDIFEQLRRRILNLDESISEKINRHYIAYKLNTNFVGIMPQARRLLLHLKLPFPDLTDPRVLCRDVTNIGTYFAGDVEVGISSVDQLDYIMSLIDQAFDRQR